MRLVICAVVLSAGAITVLTGCEPNQLYMGSRTVVGVNASLNPEQTTGSLIIGYDRNFAAVIPRSAELNQPGAGQPSQKRDAMTAIACSSLYVKGVTIKKFTEAIATGEAADKFAGALGNNPKPIKDFFVCFKDSDGESSGNSAETQGGTK